ncbi:MAG: hypothetical protein ACYTGC_13465, partial [Planctomycetota bacterium]
FYHKLAEALGMRDIDFEDFPEFSKKYALSGPNDEEIRKVFTPDVIDQLRHRERRPCVESAGGWLLVYRHGRRQPPDRIYEFLEEAFEICNQLT